MAYLEHATITDLRRAIGEGLTGLIAGQARSGVTWLVNQVVTTGFDKVVRISVRNVDSADAVRRLLVSGLALPSSVSRPSDLQVGLQERGLALVPRVVVINDLHRCDPEARKWVLQATLEPVLGGGRTACAFILEGAFDVQHSLAEAFPAGLGLQPMICHAEPTVAWRILAEVDAILRARWRSSFSAAIVPWMADISGGDVGIIEDLLSRLPGSGELRDATLGAALRSAIDQGQRSREIGRSLAGVPVDDTLRDLVIGFGVRGEPPAIESRTSLRDLYVAGVVEFNGVTETYRLRSSVAFELAAKRCGIDAGGVDENECVTARLLVFLTYVASLELDLRRSLRTHDPVGISRRVSVETPFSKEFQKGIRDLVAKLIPGATKQLGEFGRALGELLPESVPLMKDLERRHKREDLTPQAVLSGSTFSQLVAMVRDVVPLGERLEGLLAGINESRNDLAHFRGTSYERSRSLVDAVAAARTGLFPLFAKARATAARAASQPEPALARPVEEIPASTPVASASAAPGVAEGSEVTSEALPAAPLATDPSIPPKVETEK